jgi:predicted ATPase
VHAAGAVDPRGRAWLLAGDSGAGKSTLACALAGAGWSVLGDDGVVVEVAEERVVAYAWRAPLRVSEAVAARFPSVGRTAARLADDGARARVAVSAPLARRAPVAALVFVVRGGRDAVTRLAPTSALAALVRQSPWALLADEDARAHLRALRRVVALVPAFRRLRVGDEVEFTIPPGKLHLFDPETKQSLLDVR